MTTDPFTEAENITIPRPHVPYGPEGITAEQADAGGLREAARKLEEHYKPFGSNLRATVVKLVRDAADAVETSRTHLAAQEDDGHDGWCGCGCQDAQEPDDAEVEAAARALARPYIGRNWHLISERDRSTYCEDARAALSAARAARRDEEKR